MEKHTSFKIHMTCSRQRSQLSSTWPPLRAENGGDIWFHHTHNIILIWRSLEGM